MPPGFFVSGSIGTLVLISSVLHAGLALALSHDASTKSAIFSSASPMSFDHTPTGVPRAVVVFVTQAGSSDDQIVRVAYGGVPLNRIWSASDTAGEAGRVYGFFLGNAVPAGTQGVAIAHRGASEPKVAVAITLTGSHDVEILQVPGRLEENQSNPRIALDSGAREALRYSVLYSGHDSIASLSPLPGTIPVRNEDFGASVTRTLRETSTSAGSTTTGYTSWPEDVAMLAVALADVVVGGGGSGAVPHVARVVTTPAMNAGTSLVDVPGASISAAELEAAGIGVGDPVYVQAIAHLGNSDGATRSTMALVHGSTVFQNLDGDPIQPEVYATQDGTKNTPFLHFLWTRAPGEGIRLQFASVEGGAAQIDQVFVLALGLAGLRRNVDWFWSEVGEELDLVSGDESNGPFTDGASLTVVPSGSIPRFAVFTTAHIEHAATIASKPRTQLTRSGAVSDDEPHQGFFGGVAGQTSAMGLMRVFSLPGRTRSDFVLQDNESGTSASSRRLSSIFGLDLGRFRRASSAYTFDEEPLASTSYGTQLQTIDIVPRAGSPVWVCGFWGYNPSSVNRDAAFRVQVDDEDDPEGQTGDGYRFNGEFTDGGSQGYFLGNVTALTGASHAIDLDASVDSTAGDSGGEIRALFAVELVYAPPIANVPSLRLVGLAVLASCLVVAARVRLGR